MVCTMDERIKLVKDKIGRWLREENIFPQEALDPQAQFNFYVQHGTLNVNIVQKVDWHDSIVVGTHVILGPLSSKIDQLDYEKKQEFFWDLSLELLKNGDIGDFDITPDPPDNVREVLIKSRPIFYDGLTKDRLMNTMYAMFKAMIMIPCLIAKYTILPEVPEALEVPEVPQEPPYSFYIR
ncbi:MAG: DUF2299 domain-containing protein [Methanophagales archaeon ANME-1-THS]|nr:MAG: DUF2299 domain-containing protein [Methanophagales archaeon ANME-1-THS]